MDDNRTNRAGGDNLRNTDKRRITELQRAVDERDETIRLLNEALSRALDELEAADRPAA